MAARVELRSITNEEGNRLLRIIRRGSGSVVTWRRAQIVLLAAQRMPAAKIAEVAFTDADAVRELIHPRPRNPDAADRRLQRLAQRSSRRPQAATPDARRARTQGGRPTNTANVA